VQSKLARFTERCVAISQKSVGNGSEPAVKKGEGGYADWVIVAIHGLREYLGHTYRQLLDVLREMPRIVAKLGLNTDELPDFTTICTRKQQLEMRIWRVLLRLSAELHHTGHVQPIDSTSIAQRSSSFNHSKRVKDTFESVKTTALVDCESGALLYFHLR
jgi:hypothetical protein